MTPTADEEGSFRHDVFTDSWVVVAPARRRVRVVGRAPDSLPGLDGECAFCPGNEHMTGEATLVVPLDSGEGWAVRVVENLFPAVRDDARLSYAPIGGRAAPALGVQEVVIDGPDHDRDLVDFSVEELARLLRVYRDRVGALSSRAGVKYVALFRNRGRRAGSSQPHPHAQLAATAVGGREQTTRWRLAQEHWRAHGQTLLSAALTRELDAETRVVAHTSAFVAFTPFAPHGPFELWLAARDTPCLRAVDDAGLAELAGLLSRCLPATLAASGRSAYNLVFRLPPVDALSDPAAFWTLEIRPRGGGPAGLELTSGLDVVAVSPEECATEIRAHMA